MKLWIDNLFKKKNHTSGLKSENILNPVELKSLKSVSYEARICIFYFHLNSTDRFTDFTLPIGRYLGL